MIAFQHLTKIQVRPSLDIKILRKETDMPSERLQNLLDWRAKQIEEGRDYFQNGRLGGGKWECFFFCN